MKAKIHCLRTIVSATTLHLLIKLRDREDKMAGSCTKPRSAILQTLDLLVHPGNEIFSPIVATALAVPRILCDKIIPFALRLRVKQSEISRICVTHPLVPFHGYPDVVGYSPRQVGKIRY